MRGRRMKCPAARAERAGISLLLERRQDYPVSVALGLSSGCRAVALPQIPSRRLDFCLLRMCHRGNSGGSALDQEKRIGRAVWCRDGPDGGAPVLAQSAYPGRAIGMVAPHLSGEIDDASRPIDDQPKIGLDAIAIVENKSGAGATLGADEVAKSDSDGAAHPACTMDRTRRPRFRAVVRRICGARTAARSTMRWAGIHATAVRSSPRRRDARSRCTAQRRSACNSRHRTAGLSHPGWLRHLRWRYTGFVPA